MSIRDARLINHFEVRKHKKFDEPFVARCSLGWSVYGPDRHLKDYKLTRSNIVYIFNKDLNIKIDKLLEEQFAEKIYDNTEIPSIEDKLVIKKYENFTKKTLETVLKLDWSLKRII